MGNDSLPHLSPNLHFNLKFKMLKRKLSSEMGLLNTLQAESLRARRSRQSAESERGRGGRPVLRRGRTYQGSGEDVRHGAADGRSRHGERLRQTGLGAVRIVRLNVPD